MKLNKLKWLLVIPALLLTAGICGWWWLMHTESGGRWIFNQASAFIGNSITAKRITGDLGSGMHLEQFQYADDGTQVDAEQLSIAINIDLLPLHIVIEHLHASAIQIRTQPSTSGATAGEDAFPIPVLPFSVTFAAIRLSGIEYLESSAETGLVIDSIDAAGTLHEDLTLDHFSIALPEDRAMLSGQLAIQSPHAISLEFQVQGRFELSGSLDGDLDSARLAIDATHPEVKISGTVGQLLQAPVWALQINSPAIQVPLEGPESAAKFSDVQAQTAGEWPRYNLDLATTVEAAGLEPSRLELSGSGTISDFTARQVKFEGPELSLEASGSIAWEDSLDLNLDTVLNRFDPEKWIPDWPEGHPVSGAFAVDWDGEDLTISHLNFAVADTELSVNGHGIVALQSGTVDVALNWHDLNWPLDSLSPTVSSKSGDIRVSGRTEDWKLDGTLDLQSGNFPPGQLQLSGTGDTESLDITIHEGKVLGGSIAGNLDWRWTASQPFNAEIIAQQISVTPLLPDYPGVLNTRLKLNGELEPFRIGVVVQELDGTIRQQPVTGMGSFRIEQDRMFADGIQLASGASTLTLDGSLFEAGGIDFSANIDSLGRFTENLSGSLNAAGNISLDPGAPRISASLSGQKLELGGVEIEQIETRNSEIVLSGLVVGKRSIESMAIRFDGEQPLTRMAVNARLEGIDIDLELAGSLNDWNDPLASGWSGELTELRLDHQGHFALALDQPASLELTPRRFVLQQACLNGTGGDHLCMATSWAAPDELHISADLSAIPAGLIELFIDTELRFTQTLNGNLNWSQTAAEGRTGAVLVELSPGAIHMVDDDVMLLETGPGFFGFELNNGQLQKGKFDLNVPGSGDIDFDFSVPDLRQGSYSPIQGSTRINLHDLSNIGKIFPVFDAVSGALDLDLSLSGIISNPAFSGRVALSDGHFANSATGFFFTEVNLSGEVSDMDRSELTGTFRAGEGTGDITAIVYFEDILSPVIEMALKGESLTVIDVPDLHLIADPDVQLEWRNNTLNINGRIVVPRSRLSPSDIPQAAIAQSSDVVIVAGELPRPESNFIRDNAIKLRGDLEIELGNQNFVELDFAKFQVTGKTKFRWIDEMIPIANGNFNVQGDIQAFGQLLHLTRGRINFPGIPADNPHLNIRAERDIYGSTQIRKAGLMVAGTLRRPIVEPYTVPMTNRDRARTLLITGSDFNYEQGVGAVAVGTYILPRLYVSYGIGVFEDENVLSIRYDLGRGFGVKVTSGQRSSGLDLNYTIDR